jgi:hypothetical protein
MADVSYGSIHWTTVRQPWRGWEGGFTNYFAVRGVSYAVDGIILMLPFYACVGGLVPAEKSLPFFGNDFSAGSGKIGLSVTSPLRSPTVASPLRIP